MAPRYTQYVCFSWPDAGVGPLHAQYGIWPFCWGGPPIPECRPLCPRETGPADVIGKGNAGYGNYTGFLIKTTVGWSVGWLV